MTEHYNSFSSLQVRIEQDYYTYIGADGLLRCRNHLAEIAEATYLVRIASVMSGARYYPSGKHTIIRQAPRVYDYYQKLLATGLCVACWHQAYAAQWPLQYIDQTVFDPAGNVIVSHEKIKSEKHFTIPNKTLDYIINNQRLLKIHVYDNYTHQLEY